MTPWFAPTVMGSVVNVAGFADVDQPAIAVRTGRLERLGHDPAGRREELDEAVAVAGQTTELGGVPDLEPRARRVAALAGQPLDLGLQLLPGADGVHPSRIPGDPGNAPGGRPVDRGQEGRVEHQ